MSKPTFVLVPGAWHGPESFSPLTRLLEKHGYVVDAVPLASVGSSPPRSGFNEDVDNVTTILEKHADMGSDIVLVTHSYGGIPGSSACQGLLTADREAVGKTGGVIHLVYIAAFAVDKDVCLMDGLGGNPLPWWTFDDDRESMTPEGPIQIFYNDIDDEGTLSRLVSGLKPQTYAAFKGRSTYVPWLEIGTTYILCSKDNALPFEAQEAMVSNAKKVIEDRGCNVNIHDIKLETSHTPFVSQPEMVAHILRKAAGEEA